MKTIFSIDIIEFLENENIDYQCNSKLQEFYIIASIFNPIRQGFYFFLGNQVPEAVTNSVLFIKQGNDVTLYNGNVGIYISKDPQEVFYALLAAFYKTVSSGAIAPTAIIHPEAKIGNNVQIDHFSIIGKAEIGANTVIRSHCYIHDNSIIGEHVVIENQSIIGAQGVAWIWNNEQTEKIVQPQLGGVLIKEHCFLGANTIVVRGSLNENTLIGKNTLFAPGCRIGHGTQIGDFVHFANNIITGGNAIIGDNCFVGSAAVFRPKVTLHENTVVGAGAVVVKNTTASGKTLMGVPAVEMDTKLHPKGMPKPKSINN